MKQLSMLEKWYPFIKWGYGYEFDKTDISFTINNKLCIFWDKEDEYWYIGSYKQINYTWDGFVNDLINYLIYKKFY